jgi:hypothetical protein
MLPPGFVRYYDGKGLNQPLCRECVHYVDERFTARGICWEYGAYVSLYSSCGSFVRRVGSSTPIVDEDQVRVSHRSGLSDLTE